MKSGLRPLTSHPSFNPIQQMSHPQGWTSHYHYSNMGGQCGQSCPCCRAYVYNQGNDPDAWFGACPICIKNTTKMK